MTVSWENVRPIRVLIVDDSAFMRIALTRMIGSDPDMEVVATACCASEALEKIAELDPDVVTLDVAMPGLDGIGTLHCIMDQFPRAVIMVTATMDKNGDSRLEWMKAGAFDFVSKQLSANSLEIAHIRQELIVKIRAAADLYRARAVSSSSKKPPSCAARHSRPASEVHSVVAIGVSTGGPKALEQIMPLFPEDFPAAILIVQHMPVGFTTPLATRLDALAQIKVKEAIDGELIRPAHAYIAPAGVHMRVARRRSDSKPTISLSPEPEDALHRPSVDILMNSVAELFKRRAIGVIMTGMGSDGAAGMASIFRQGGLTIGQDEPSCAVYGMPRVCAQLGILTHVLSLNQIPAQIVSTTLRAVDTHSER